MTDQETKGMVKRALKRLHERDPKFLYHVSVVVDEVVTTELLGEASPTYQTVEMTLEQLADEGKIERSITTKERYPREETRTMRLNGYRYKENSD